VGALEPFDCKTCPAVPVDELTDKVPVNDKVVKNPAAAVVAPIDILFIVPAVAGLTINVPVPVGAIEML
jgi:hypothetical protein